MATVRARYEKGVLTPLEPLEIKDGTEVIVSIENVPESVRSNNTPPRSKGLLGIVERVREVQDSMPPEVWENLPTDGARNKKHYLYGHPKEEA